MTTTLGWPIPPKPSAFTPDGAPAGVELRFVTFAAGRPHIRPRSIFVHTNGASREGSVDSAWNWAHAAPNKNTCPHYQVDRAHNGVLRARKMLPSDRQGIANATITSSHKDWPNLTQAQRDSILAAGNKSIATWSLAIETADLGWPDPGAACGFEEAQGEMIAAILAYEAIVHSFPLVKLSAWDGAGVAAHTEPFTRPYTTLYVKPCPGAQKKADLWSWVLPRAVEIQNAWLDHPPVDPPVYPPLSEEDVMKTVITRWGDEPYLIEVGDLYPGSTQRPWRGIANDEADRLIAVGLAEDRRAAGLPMSLKGSGPEAPAPQYKRIG